MEKTVEELRAILITCDGKGKEAKEAALAALMSMEYNRGACCFQKNT